MDEKQRLIRLKEALIDNKFDFDDLTWFWFTLGELYAMYETPDKLTPIFENSDNLTKAYNISVALYKKVCETKIDLTKQEIIDFIHKH